MRPQKSLTLYKAFNPLCTWHNCSRPFCFDILYLWRHLQNMFPLLPYRLSVVKQTFSRRFKDWRRVADPGYGCGSGSSGSECPYFAKNIINFNIILILNCKKGSFLFLRNMLKERMMCFHWYFLKIIRIHMRNKDPDPAIQMNTDHSGSASASLNLSITKK